MRSKKKLLLFIFTVLAAIIHAQTGFIRGTVYDDATGDVLPGVTLFLEGTTTGALTDLDGKFNIKAPAGIYTLRVSYISYETLNIKDVGVKTGEVTLLDDLRLKETTIELAEVTITAQGVRNTESALITMKRKSATLMDGISAASFRKIGDSDAAASMKRVTGLSVEGGKYVYVRGLGDRYTKTILNGVDIPGLDPDRNTIQLDLFPTNIIDNIIVHKSFSADLPADFTGGVIDINIKDFPEEKQGNISLSLGYNPYFHFNDQYLTYKGGGTDFLGFDDGTRKIPATSDIPLFSQVVGDPYGAEGKRYRQILESFNPNMAAYNTMSMMDYSLGASFGNQVPVKKTTLGYNLALSYKSNTEFFRNAEYGRYGLSSDPDNYEMEVREFQKGDFGTHSVLWSALAGFAVKTSGSKYRLNLLHLQNGESKAGIFDYTGSDQGSEFSGFQHNLEYGERSITNLLIDGKTTFPKSKWTLEWKVSPTLANMQDPDIRFTRYISEGGKYLINTESGFPERIWRELKETNIVGLVNITKEFMFRKEKAQVKYGPYYA